MEKIKQFYKETKKSTFIVYVTLRLFVIISMILQIINRNWNDVFLCILTLMLFTVPYLIDKKLNIRLPNVLECIILIFIFSAEILGEIQNFYGIFKSWDTILHTINGFLCAAIGFSLIDILNRNEKFHIKLSPAFVALVAFCFSMTVGVLWEFFEFGLDSVVRSDMQKDKIVSTVSSVTLHPEGANQPIVIKDINRTEMYLEDEQGNISTYIIENGYLDIGLIDTMKDLLVNFVGAVVFSLLGLLYIKDRDEYKFSEKFIPVLKKKEKDKDKENVDL